MNAIKAGDFNLYFDLYFERAHNYHADNSGHGVPAQAANTSGREG